MADYQNLSERDLNQINGSSSALGEGSFKRRDALRRAESLQRNKIKMGERLDRSINRAARKGDVRAASAFNDLRQSISGQGFGGTGIGSPDDRDERVKDGVLKGADFRHGVGNIGNTAPAEGPIANAPPPVEKPQGSPTYPSSFSGVPILGGVLDAAPQTALEGVQAQSPPPITRTEPGGLAATRKAVSKLVTKFKKGSIDPVAMQSAYQAEMGDPADQAFNAAPLETVPKTPVSQKPARASSQEDIAFGDRVGVAAGNVKNGVDALGKKIDGSLDDAAARRAIYDKSEAERLRKRNEGMAAVDSKLQSEITRADQAYSAQKEIRSAYEKDYKAVERRNQQYVKDLNGYDPIAKAGAGLFGEMEQWPEMPTPINYDTFDPANPPKYQRQLAPKQTYKAPAYTGKGYSDNDMSQAAIMYRQIQAQKALKTYVQPPTNPLPL